MQRDFFDRRLEILNGQEPTGNLVANVLRCAHDEDGGVPRLDATAVDVHLETNAAGLQAGKAHGLRSCESHIDGVSLLLLYILRQGERRR